MSNFDLENYVQVQDRIADFFKDFPDGSIRTRMVVRHGPDVVFEARVFRTPEDVSGNVYTSGWAQETEGKGGPVNRTSWIENCETSSIGRALANLGYAAKADRASRSEMLKVHRTRKEHEEALEEIRAAGARCPEETEIRIGGVVRNLKAFVRENWPALKEQFRLARAVVEAIGEAEGREDGITPSEAADARPAPSMDPFGVRLGGKSEWKDKPLVDVPTQELEKARDAPLKRKREKGGELDPGWTDHLLAIQSVLDARETV